MSRLSFSHTLLASFLLIAAILGAAAMGGVLALEELAVRSRDGARDTLGFSTAVQQLGERTVDMERSARQFLVLDDPVLLARFREAHADSLAALGRIAALGTPATATLIEDWTSAAAAAATALDRPAGVAPTVEALGRLPLLNEQLAAEFRARLDRDTEDLLDSLDANRNRLAWHLIAAVIFASLLAALTGWWVLRPLARVERAIEALGESRFDQPVVIDGPADLRRLGRRLEWLRLRLADLESNRARVLRHVSHELKTPLASLREGIALLEDGVVGALNGQQRTVVGILQHNTRALQKRIEGLLGYNSAVFDARTLKRRPLAVRPLLEAAVAEQQLSIQGRNLAVRIVGDAPILSADADKLRIVFANLVANAVSFSPQNGAIRLELGAPPGWVRVDCIDEGPGVPREEAERIFEPFFQGSRQPAVARQGSGLGLSIVREFVAAHGGRVELLPSAGGAHFRVELPHER
jgi:two-component system sensor histidine kinase GlrK